MTPAIRLLDAQRVRYRLHEYAHDPRAASYVVGGISPLGQCRRLETIVDESALAHETVHVSAGRRGLEVELDPRNLVRLANARVAPCVGSTEHGK